MRQPLHIGVSLAYIQFLFNKNISYCLSLNFLRKLVDKWRSSRQYILSLFHNF